jgi:phosphoserine phosphatase/glycine cleavage system regulatory protein
MLVDVHGVNQVGITLAFVNVINDAGEGAKILDIVQYVVEGSLSSHCLSITFMIEIGEGNPMLLIKGMLSVAQSLKMQLDFRFPERNEEQDISVAEAKEGNILSVAIVLDSALNLDILCEIFGYFAAHSCQILEIEHRNDNRIEINDHLTKIDIRISSPSDVSLPTLYLELQPLLWKFNAELVVRPWSALNRPNGRSLFVFGLSEVLLHGCPLDDLLRRSGTDPVSIDMTGAKSLEQCDRKVKALAGCDACIMDQVINELRFTSDAEFVCHSLKSMGFRLAVLSSSSCKLVANAVKERLGIDYVLSRDVEIDDNGKFTGDFAGEVKDLKFRKTDFLQLMAEKESIPYKNVIVVGEFLEDMKRHCLGEFLNS